MQPEGPPDPGSQARQILEEGPSAGPKRPRLGERSFKTTTVSEEAASSDAPAASGSHNTLRVSTQQRGSSHESDMQRSATPPDGAGPVKYTRTGRVSKASKGRRIHQCDECGKIYTRAEHLRRHQQNHKPGVFPCDVPGCSRSFYREDLLTRHKARHNDPLNPPSRRPSIGSQSSEHGIDHIISGNPERASSTQYTVAAPDSVPLDGHALTAAPTPSIQQPTASRAPRKDYIPITQLHAASEVTTSLNPSGTYTFGGPWQPSSPDSATGYNSPTNALSYHSGPPYYQQPHPARTRYSSDTSFGGLVYPSTCRSPVSAGSSAGAMPSWSQHTQILHPDLHNAGVFSRAVHGTTIDKRPMLGSTFGSQHLIPTYFNGIPTSMTAEDRDRQEAEKLQIPLTLTLDNSYDLGLDDVLRSNEQRCLFAYWTWIHPHFPVVRKPSFDYTNASPLLRAIMFALGSHMLQTAEDMTIARNIHERCMKVVKERTVKGWHTDRVCDMQAIVLVEVYSVFKSRRPPLQLSTCFEDVYRSLLADPDALSHDIAHDTPLRTNVPPDSNRFDEFTEESIRAHDAECKQRLLLVCYILDVQNARLFGREQTQCLPSQGLNSMHLPMPRSQQSWDSTLEDHAHDRFQRKISGTPSICQVGEALGSLSTMTGLFESPLDAFQSQLLLACLVDTANDSVPLGFGTDDDNELPRLLSAVEQTPRTRLVYHAFTLCEHTPVRDLLAVAGESWVLAEKLGTMEEFASSQLEAMQWARESAAEPSSGSDSGNHEAPVHRALFHALRILDGHRKHPNTGVLFQEWSLYLAAVVIWARSYVVAGESRRRRHLSIPSPAEPRLSPAELERSVTRAIEAGHLASCSWVDARNVLLWVKQKIEKVGLPHQCGLTNGALDVLGRLVTRGNEEGWFG